MKRDGRHADEEGAEGEDVRLEGDCEVSRQRSEVAGAHIRRPLFDERSEEFGRRAPRRPGSSANEAGARTPHVLPRSGGQVRDVRPEDSRQNPSSAKTKPRGRSRNLLESRSGSWFPQRENFSTVIAGFSWEWVLAATPMS